MTNELPGLFGVAVALGAPLTRMRGWLSVTGYWRGRAGHPYAGRIPLPYPPVLSCVLDQDFPYGGHSE